MAHFVEEGAEGNTTKVSNPGQTLAQWLMENRLKKLAPYFDDEEGRTLFTFLHSKFIRNSFTIHFSLKYVFPKSFFPI